MSEPNLSHLASRRHGRLLDMRVRTWAIIASPHQPEGAKSPAGWLDDWKWPNPHSATSAKLFPHARPARLLPLRFGHRIVFWTRIETSTNCVAHALDALPPLALATVCHASAAASTQLTQNWQLWATPRHFPPQQAQGPKENAAVPSTSTLQDIRERPVKQNVHLACIVPGPDLNPTSQVHLTSITDQLASSKDLNPEFWP